ncbi:hypothetical protein ACFXGA_25165 [Actinosynnema sp. NPDC059335]|uniref:hypothetical protein n=1 Tax=Actinosynnema sp. NPDC059335 TaxID=3346804 RepID=UPI00366B5D67
MVNSAWQVLEYRDVRYGLRRVEVREAATPLPPTGSPLAVRPLVTTDGRRLVQKSVPRAEGQPDDDLYDRLDREIRAGARLARRFAGLPYPTGLSELVGYDIDVEEPYVLLAHYRGEPVAGQAGRLLTHQQHRFEVGLLHALRELEAAKVVHGDISPRTVWWDGDDVQLVGFEHAVLVGEPRVRNVGSPTGSPQQRAGDGPADVRDDLWSAGAVVLHVVTGDVGATPDPHAAGDALVDLLAGVFAPTPGERPHPVELLDRLAVADRVPPRADRTAVAFGQARAKFDEVLVAKRPGRDAPAPAPPRRDARRVSAVWLAVVSAAVVVLAVTAVLVNGGLW